MNIDSILILVIIFSSLTIVFLVRKYSGQIANIEINQISNTKIKEQVVKEQIISERLKRNYKKIFESIFGFISPFVSKVSSKLKDLFKNLHETRERHKIAKENNQVTEDNQSNDEINLLFDEVQGLVNDNNYDEAEKKIIRIIELDHKNIDAFVALAEVYYEKKSYEEAKQTFEHILKIGGDDSEIYHELCMVYDALDDLDGALGSINKALNMEPNNHRFLDVKLDIEIAKKDKIAAHDTLEKIKKANPENGNIANWEKSIASL